MDIDRVMPKLGEVFLDASSPASREVTQYKTGLFGRSQVIIIIIIIIIIILLSPGGNLRHVAAGVLSVQCKGWITSSDSR